nr:MAG TPA: hypothetical protein [Caudoviricetes sp.]
MMIFKSLLLSKAKHLYGTNILIFNRCFDNNLR